MPTNLDIITDAYRKANIIKERSVPTATQAQDGLTLLNDMMSDWEEDGIELGYYPVPLASEIPVEEKFLRGIKYNLSRGMSADKGIDPLPEIARIASLTLDRLMKATTEVVNTDFSHIPTGNTGRYTIVSDT